MVDTLRYNPAVDLGTDFISALGPREFLAVAEANQQRAMRALDATASEEQRAAFLFTDQLRIKVGQLALSKIKITGEDKDPFADAVIAIAQKLGEKGFEQLWHAKRIAEIGFAIDGLFREKAESQYPYLLLREDQGGLAIEAGDITGYSRGKGREWAWRVNVDGLPEIFLPRTKANGEIICDSLTSVTTDVESPKRLIVPHEKTLAISDDEYQVYLRSFVGASSEYSQGFPNNTAMLGLGERGVMNLYKQMYHTLQPLYVQTALGRLEFDLLISNIQAIHGARAQSDSVFRIEAAKPFRKSFEDAIKKEFSAELHVSSNSLAKPSLQALVWLRCRHDSPIDKQRLIWRVTMNLYNRHPLRESINFNTLFEAVASDLQQLLSLN